MAKSGNRREGEWPRRHRSPNRRPPQSPSLSRGAAEAGRLLRAQLKGGPKAPASIRTEKTMFLLETGGPPQRHAPVTLVTLPTWAPRWVTNLQTRRVGSVYHDGKVAGQRRL